MRLFTFGRAARLAMLGGAIYYVRKNGGLKATWERLTEKVKPPLDAKNAENVGATSTEATPSTETMGPSKPMYPGSTSGVGSGVGSGIPDFSEKGGDKTTE